MISSWFKKKIKELLPEYLLETVRGYMLKARKPNLFDDKKFISYVHRKMLGLENNKNRIETLALRGSTADYGFFPGGMHCYYNLGLTSSDLFTAYHLYLYCRIKLTKLSRVIVFVNPASIGYSLINTNERYRAVSYKKFFNVPYQENHKINKRYERQILKRCKTMPVPSVDDDYCGFDDKPGFQADVQRRAQIHLRENKRVPDQIPWLLALHEAVTADGKSLYVVVAPARSDYKTYLPDQRALFKKVYDLEKNGIRILDFYNSNEIHDIHMADADHLNMVGARILTEMIVKRI